MSFLFGESGGLALGAAISYYGRYSYTPLLVVFVCAVSTVAGFARTSIVLTILRGILGFLTSTFTLLVVASVLDMSISRRQRALFSAYILVWILAGQAVGPWITRVVLKVGTWYVRIFRENAELTFIYRHWLYWLMAIFSLAFIPVYGLLSKETDACTIYRAVVRRLQAHNSSIWTPEPRTSPTFKQFIRHQVIRPQIVLVRHLLVALCAFVLIVAVGTTVGLLTSVSPILIDVHRMEDWKAALILSICIGLGLGSAVLCIFFFSHSRNAGEEDKDDNPRRTRLLYMDEKGLIDAHRPAFDAEVLLKLSFAGFITLVVGQYTLALTATVANWIFAALSMTITVAGAAILTTSILDYIAESYYPSCKTVLGELLALADHLGPAPRMTQRSPSEEGDDHTLMSGADEDGRRWDSSWALSALASVAGGGLLAAGAFSLLGPLATAKIGFPLFAAIMASCCLGCVGLILVVVYRRGATLRHAAFKHIAHTEQKLWLESRRNLSDAPASAATSTTQTQRNIASAQWVRSVAETAATPPDWKKRLGHGLRHFLLPSPARSRATSRVGPPDAIENADLLPVSQRPRTRSVGGSANEDNASQRSPRKKSRGFRGWRILKGDKGGEKSSSYNISPPYDFRQGPPKEIEYIRTATPVMPRRPPPVIVSQVSSPTAGEMGQAKEGDVLATPSPRDERSFTWRKNVGQVSRYKRRSSQDQQQPLSPTVDQIRQMDAEAYESYIHGHRNQAPWSSTHELAGVHAGSRDAHAAAQHAQHIWAQRQRQTSWGGQGPELDPAHPR